MLAEMGGIISKRVFAVLFVVLLVSWPGTAVAQSDELMQAYQQYQALNKQGRYAEAERFARKALELGEQEFGPEHPTTATLLNNLASLYRAQGRYADAEPLLKRALAIKEKALGPEHPTAAIFLNNLALLYQAQGRYADVEPLLKRALAIWEKALGPDHPDVGESLNNLALLYDAQGRHADAEPLYKRALAIVERAIVKSCVWADHAAARSWRSPSTNLTPRMISAS